jgi:hypothetical protein
MNRLPVGESGLWIGNLSDDLPAEIRELHRIRPA